MRFFLVVLLALALADSAFAACRYVYNPFTNNMDCIPVGAGAGTVTSVAVSVPTDILAVSGSPVTGAGTIAITKANQNANIVLAGPGSGGAAAPAFRALVLGDMPTEVKPVGSSGQVLVSAGTAAAPTAHAGLAFNSGTNALGVIGSVGVGQTGTVTGEIRINGTTSGTVTIKSADAAGTWTMTLPANDGDSGQFLQTNGSGVGTWATPSSGTTYGDVRTVNEVPSGTINGTNDTFTLAATPVTGSVQVWVNGVLQLPTTHFTVSTATITFASGAIPQTGQNVLASYTTSNTVASFKTSPYIAAAGCQGTTANLLWDAPASNAPAAACVNSNAVAGVADFDAATDESMHIDFALPADWTGAIDARVFGFAAATSGTVRLGINIDCVAAGEALDPSITNASTFNWTPNGTTNRLSIASVTSITVTGCAAGELSRVRIYRDADGTSGTDDMSGDFRLKGVELTVRRTQL